ncbi:MAG: D-aminoacyl-tRNA deacylase [bacterium]
MRAVVQRVLSAQVRVKGEVVGKIGKGLLILLGVAPTDTEAEVAWMAEKCAGLRIFEDDEGKMNRSLEEVGGAALVISQFTLFGDCRKGKRPSFVGAAPPELAEALYEKFVQNLRGRGIITESGIFAARMEVELTNYGPVTLIIDK